MGRLQRKKVTTSKKKKKSTSAVVKTDAVPKETEQNDAQKLKVVKQPQPSASKKVAASTKPAAAKTKEPNLYQKAIQFLREVKVELKKVTWPSRKQTVGSTVVVVIIVMIIGFFLGAVDIGLSSLVKIVLQ